LRTCAKLVGLNCTQSKFKELLDYKNNLTFIILPQEKALMEKDEAYKEKNKPVLERYTSTSKELGKAYDLLIDNLFKDPAANEKLEYNWKTNTYK
jgi:hypothetical protein